jgi:hypothetical protein
MGSGMATEAGCFGNRSPTAKGLLQFLLPILFKTTADVTTSSPRMSGVCDEPVPPSTTKNVQSWRRASGPVALVVDVVGGQKTTVWAIKQSEQQTSPQATVLATMPPLDKNFVDRNIGVDSWDWDSNQKELNALKNTIYYLVEAIRPSHCFATFSWDEQCSDAERLKNEQFFMINFPEFSTKKQSLSSEGERQKSGSESKEQVLIECFNTMTLEQSFCRSGSGSFMSVSLEDSFSSAGSFSYDSSDEDW